MSLSLVPDCCRRILSLIVRGPCLCLRLMTADEMQLRVQACSLSSNRAGLDRPGFVVRMDELIIILYSVGLFFALF